jgi:hypothetical protein
MAEDNFCFSENPVVSRKILESKFAMLTGEVLAPARAGEIAEMIWAHARG